MTRPTCTTGRWPQGPFTGSSVGQGMQELGFELKERQIGSSIGWELACIPQAWIDDTSKRRAEIEEKLALRKGSLDAADSRYAELVAKETRRTKDTEKPRDELFEKWQEEAREHGITPESLRGQLRAGIKALRAFSPESETPGRKSSGRKPPRPSRSSTRTGTRLT